MTTNLVLTSLTQWLQPQDCMGTLKSKEVNPKNMHSTLITQ